MLDQSWFWIFNLFIVLCLAIDLWFFDRKKHVIRVQEALWMSAFWVTTAMLFNLALYFVRGEEAALNFLTGYLVEKALSIDNLFVFLLIFSYFRVPPHLLHKVLFWGIFGAIAMRALFIFAGIALVQNFHRVIYLFGGFLVLTGVKLMQDKKIQSESNRIIQFFQGWVPMTPQYVEDRFFVKKEGRYFATPLFLVLLVIETTDVLFALDSIPAIIGITEDPFIVYTSNILAILGLRSLYFALSHSMTLFHYLHYGLACTLLFIGIKMLLSGYIALPIMLCLAIILCILGISIAASLRYPKKDPS
jgi:tellurite resistance protein TerC